jgi:hypothetical protein
VLTAPLDVPRVRFLPPDDEVEQGRLTGSRGSDESHQLAGMKFEAHIRESVNLLGSAPIALE